MGRATPADSLLGDATIFSDNDSSVCLVILVYWTSVMQQMRIAMADVGESNVEMRGQNYGNVATDMAEIAFRSLSKSKSIVSLCQKREKRATEELKT